MVWGCFSGQGMGLISVITDTLTGIGYRYILNDVMYPHAGKTMPLVWRFFKCLSVKGNGSSKNRILLQLYHDADTLHGGLVVDV